MQHHGEKTRATKVQRRKAERGGLFRGHGPSASGRSFDEDLALFERQARGERAGRPAGLVSNAALLV